METALPAELADYIAQKVESGLYASADAAPLDALRLLPLRDVHEVKLAKLRADIAVGAEQADRRKTRPFDDAIPAKILGRGRERITGRDERLQS